MTNTSIETFASFFLKYMHDLTSLNGILDKGTYLNLVLITFSIFIDNSDHIGIVGKQH